MGVQHMRKIKLQEKNIRGRVDEVVLSMYEMLDKRKSGEFGEIDVNLVQRILTNGRVTGDDVGRTFEELSAIKGLIAGVSASELLAVNNTMLGSVQVVLSTVPFINLDRASNGEVFKVDLETVIQTFRKHVNYGEEKDYKLKDVASGIVDVCYNSDYLMHDRDAVTYLALLPIMILAGELVIPSSNINEVLRWLDEQHFSVQ